MKTTHLALALLVMLGGCDQVSRHAFSPRTYSECLGDQLRDVRTAEGSAAIIGACRSRFDYRKEERQLSLAINGNAGVDSDYSVARTFSGVLYNPSRDLVVTRVVLRLSRTNTAAPAAASAVESLPTLYEANVTIWPMSTARFSVPVLPTTNYGSAWSVDSVYGVSVERAIELK